MRRILVAALGLLLATSTVVTAYPLQPANPVIGIVTHPMDECNTPPAGVQANSCLESFYVDWLEAAGIRVVPVPYNSSIEYHMYLAQRLNGILFPGGGSGGAQLQRYFAKAQAVFNQTLAWNAAGDPFFLWGTCMGFQVLCSCAAGTLDVITGTYPGMEPLMMALNFTAAQPSSKLLGDATCPSYVRNVLQTQNSTLNWHQDAVLTSEWTKRPALAKNLVVLSTNTAPAGNVVFASAVESPVANIFATQFHPERPPYEFSDDGIGHTAGDVAVSQYLADFIVSRLRMNNHTFETPQDAEALRIARFPRVDYGWGYKSYFVYHDDTMEAATMANKPRK